MGNGSRSLAVRHHMFVQNKVVMNTVGFGVG